MKQELIIYLKHVKTKYKVFLWVKSVIFNISGGKVIHVFFFINKKLVLNVS